MEFWPYGFLCYCLLFFIENSERLASLLTVYAHLLLYSQGCVVCSCSLAIVIHSII